MTGAGDGSAALLLRNASVAFWGELPRFLAVGVCWLGCLVPVAASLWTGAPQWVAATAALPGCLMLTVTAAAGAEVADGGRVRLQHLRQADPVLAGVLWTVGVGIQLLLAGGSLFSAFGYVLSAATALTLLPTLSYGAISGRRGVAVLRGGLTLVALAPGMAVTLCALAVLVGFAVAASGGVLLLAAPGFLATVGAAFVGNRLHHLTRSASRKNFG